MLEKCYAMWSLSYTILQLCAYRKHGYARQRAAYTASEMEPNGVKLNLSIVYWGNFPLILQRKLTRITKTVESKT